MPVINVSISDAAKNYKERKPEPRKAKVLPVKRDVSGKPKFVAFIGEGDNNLPNNGFWLIEKIDDLLRRVMFNGFNRILVPMAPGIDYNTALSAAQLRPNYKGSEVWLVQPWPVVQNRLGVVSQISYKFISGQVDRIIDLNEAMPETIKARREVRQDWYKKIIDKSEAVVAIWVGMPGHVSHAVRHAKANGKPVLHLNPETRQEAWL